jgi:hypothetical protein
VVPGRKEVKALWTQMNADLQDYIRRKLFGGKEIKFGPLFFCSS